MHLSCVGLDDMVLTDLYDFALLSANARFWRKRAFAKLLNVMPVLSPAAR